MSGRIVIAIVVVVLALYCGWRCGKFDERRRVMPQRRESVREIIETAPSSIACLDDTTDKIMRSLAAVSVRAASTENQETKP